MATFALSVRRVYLKWQHLHYFEFLITHLHMNFTVLLCYITVVSHVLVKSTSQPHETAFDMATWPSKSKYGYNLL